MPYNVDPNGEPTEPDYPEYDVISPDGTVERAEQGENVKRNAKGYIVEDRRMVPFRESPKKAKPLKYQRIPMCGHKFIPQQEPRHKGCESCWFTFFQFHGELTQAVEEVYQKQGEDFLIKLKGRQYVTNFLKFLSTIAAYKAAAEAAKETDAQSGISGTISSNEEERGACDAIQDSDPTHGIRSSEE